MTLDESDLSRRHVLGGAASVVVVGTAGCSGDDSNDDSATGGAYTASETPSRSPTPEPVARLELGNRKLSMQWTRSLWDQNSEVEVPETFVRVLDLAGFDSLGIHVTQDTESGSESRKVGEVDSDNRKEVVSIGEFLDGENNVELVADEEPVKQETVSGQEAVVDVEKPDRLRYDFVESEGDTGRTGVLFDNHVFDEQQFIEEHEKKWLKDAAYTGEYRDEEKGLIELMNEDADLKGGAYPVENIIGSEWDKDRYLGSSEFGKTLDWLQAATKAYWGRVGKHAPAPSDDDDHRAASVEYAFENVVDEDGNSHEGEITMGYLNMGGHGVMVAYSPLEELEGQSRWRVVDTGTSTNLPVDEAEYETDENDGIKGDYNPYMEQKFDPDEGPGDYLGRKGAATSGIISLASKNRESGITGEDIRITDQFADSFYSDVVGRNKRAEDVIETVRKGLDIAVDQENILIYGTNEDPRIAKVGDETFNAAFEKDEYLEIDTVENRMEESDRAESYSVSSASYDESSLSSIAKHNSFLEPLAS